VYNATTLLPRIPSIGMLDQKGWQPPPTISVVGAHHLNIGRI
jgi:hypothetical protein